MSESLADLNGQTLFLGSEDVERAFSWAAAVSTLRTIYGTPISDAMAPPRTMARGNGLWLRTLSAIAPDGGVMGAKLIAANVRNKRASYLVPLFDQETVELLALIDGNKLTGFRTAATTALGLDALARPGAISVGILGTGFEARNHLHALAAVRQISSVKVFSPTPASREKFIQDMAHLGLPLTASDNARDVVEAGPDMLLCAARSRGEQALFDGAWLQPGMTIASIGSTLPEQREVDPATIERANLIVADMPEEVAHDTGDMIAARAANVAFMDKLISLADLIGGSHPGRQSQDEILLYKSVGSALQDIAIATVCLERARELGLGAVLPGTIRPVLK